MITVVIIFIVSISALTTQILAEEIFELVKNRNSEEIQKAVDSAVDINARDEDGNIP